MLTSTIYLLIPTLTLILPTKAQTSSDSVLLPQIEETLSQALAQAERTLTDTILSNAEIRIVHHGTSNIPLDDYSIEVGNLAIVQLSNLHLCSSPIHMIALSPHLRLMNLELRANITLLQVTGNYIVSPEIMNVTSRTLISSDRGSLNLTFHDIEISGALGLHINEHHLFIHTVDLVYQPRSVVLRIKFQNSKGEEEYMEERRDTFQSSIEEPIYKDLAVRLNFLIQEQFNAILSNITIPELLENNTHAAISFKTAANNHIGNINDFVDTILNGTKDRIPDEIQIPDLEKTFQKTLGFLRFKGTFVAQQGWMRSLKTLHRTAGVTLKRANNSIEVSAAMGLSTLEFGYNRYSAKFLKVGPSGILAATVGRNSVSFRGRVGYDGNNCSVTLLELKVKELSNIVMRLTGLSPFNWMLSKVATSIVNRSKNNIIHNIEQTVGDKILNQLRTFDCSQYFPKPAVDGNGT